MSRPAAWGHEPWMGSKTGVPSPVEADEGVFGDEDVEEAGVLNHAHGGVVDVHVVGGDFGPGRGHLLGYAAPEAG